MIMSFKSNTKYICKIIIITCITKQLLLNTPTLFAFRDKTALSKFHYSHVVPYRTYFDEPIKGP